MFVADGGEGDTIVARATAAGAGARAVLRISGTAALEAAAAIFRPDVRASHETPAGPRLVSRPDAASSADPAGFPNPQGRLLLASSRDPGAMPFAVASFDALRQAEARAIVAGAIEIDDLRVPAAAVAFRAPRSFTGEDLVEIHVAGSEPLLERIADALGRRGARPARPGEFTRRAVLAGRLDLTGAESVLALCEAATEDEARAAARGLRGALGREVERLRSGILDALADVEAALDFGHEDLEQDLLGEAGVVRALEAHRAALDAVLARDAAREGAPRPPVAVLLGPANAGKSSLLNALAGAERAIVSPLAGTTRDPVAATVRATAGQVEIVDLAGLRVEGASAGLDAAAAGAAERAVAAADLLVVVLDGSVALPAAGRAALERSAGRERLLVRQKADLPPRLDPAALPGPAVAVSARTGEGIDALRQAIAGCLARRPAPAEGSGLAPNARHRACLERARAALDRGLAAAAAGTPHDLIAVDLRVALDALGEVTGSACAEDVLDRIFARFCIGK